MSDEPEPDKRPAGDVDSPLAVYSRDVLRRAHLVIVFDEHGAASMVGSDVVINDPEAQASVARVLRDFADTIEAGGW